MKVMIIKSIKNFYRSPSNIFMTIVFPVIMIFFLGTFLQNIDISDYEIGEIKIDYGVINSDNYSDMGFNMFLENADAMTSNKSESPDASKERVANEEIDAYIELDGKDIKIYCGNNGVANRTLAMIMQSYLSVSEVYYNIIEINPEGIKNSVTSEYKSYTEQSGLGISRSMMDYYAIAMVVMMSFMCFITGSAMEVKEEENYKTIMRIYISTKSKVKVFISMIISHISMAAISVLVAMLCAAFMFGAKYCDTIPENILLYIMLLSVNICVIGIGLLIGIVSKIPPVGIVMPVSWALLFFSGSFSKEIFIKGFSEYLPPYLIQQAAFDLTLFSENEKAVIVIAVSLAIFAVTSVLGAVLFSKKKVV